MLTPQLAKSFLVQGLCEDIRQLLFSVDMDDINVFLHNVISEKVMTNLNMLCLRVLNWIVGNLDGTLIVTVKRHILQVYTIVLESLLHLEELSTARSSSNVFRFSSGERYIVLLL